MRRTLLTLATLLLGAGPLVAQGAAPQPLVCPTLPDAAQVDQVVAVVGDSVILFTDLQQECRLAEQRNQQLVRDSQPPLPVTVQDLLDNLVNIQVLLQHAARDSTVIPSEQDLTNRVNMQMDTVRASFANEAAFQQALTQQGLTLNTYRDQLRAQIRTRLIQDAYTRRLLQSAPTPVVSESEMRAFYEQRKGELQALPELLTVQQVPIRSGASEDAWERARMKADSLYLLVIRGVDFAELARQHSADSASAVNGGDLGGPITRGSTVPEFDRAAFALRDGGVSAPVRTEYGYHVIRVERSRPGEKFVRHILISPERNPGDIERARTTAQDVANRIRNGESALRLAQQYGDPTIPRELRVFRGQEAQTVPPDYAQRLVGAQQGDVIGPFDANLNGPDYVVVMQVTQVRAAGQATFEEVRDQIRDVLTAQKRQERIYKDLRDKTYVEVRYGR